MTLYTGTNSQPLPALPVFTPEKFSNLAHEAEYQINTSALRRAFPDFSQHGSSDQDSVEMGRALPSHGSRNSARLLPSEDPSENISLNFGNGEKYTVTGTPPMRPKSTQNSAAKVAPMGRSVSQKENQVPAVKTTSFGSGSSGAGSEDRKQAAVFQSVEVDDSTSLPARPKSHYASAKSTRFTSPPARQPLAETKSTPNRQPHNATVDSIQSAAGGGTYQSFMLPDMPNMTELITGSRRDATPNMSRSAKSRSRFAEPSSLRRPQGARPTHHVLGDVPVPADAKALYLSLQLLQEKVQNLERERNQAIEKADSYELELLQLRSRVEEQDDTKADDADADAETGGERAKEWEAERSGFERSIKALQSRLRQASKKLAASEATVKTLTGDRDMAQQQISTAYTNSEELKNESQAVRAEVEAVKAQLARVTRQHQQRIASLVAQENELRGKIERREKAVSEMASLAKELWNTRHALARSASTRTASQRKTSFIPHGGEAEAKEPAASRGGPSAGEHPREKSVERRQEHSTRARRSNLDDSIAIEKSHPVRRVSKASTTRQQQQTHEQTQGYEDDAATQLHFAEELRHVSVEDLERCETYLSFMEGDEVAKLRQVLLEDKARLASSGQDAIDYTTLARNRQTASMSAAPRKSSLKDLTKPASKKQQQVQYQDLSEDMCQTITGDITRPISRASAHRQRIRDDNPRSQVLDFEPETTKDATRQSMRSARSEHHRRTSTVDDGVHDDNMTSAYILPDITLTGADLAQSIHPKPATADSSIPEDQGRDMHPTKGNTRFATKERTAISRPIPVSERPVSPTPSNPDPTLRPSRTPSVALALVIQSLETEIARLRAQLAKFEELYHATDPSLSKRRRKAVWARIVKIGDAVERRADQVYALYDVLEGVNLEGLGDVEITVGELGLGLDDERVRGGGVEDGKKTAERDRGESDGELDLDVGDEDLSDGNGDGNDDEDAWEGFENTATQTGGVDAR